jgi:hypothetical protein
MHVTKNLQPLNMSVTASDYVKPLYRKLQSVEVVVLFVLQIQHFKLLQLFPSTRKFVIDYT